VIAQPSRSTDTGGTRTRTAAVLLNPKAGTPRHPHLAVGPRRIAELFALAGLPAEVRFTPPGMVATAVERAVASGVDMVVVGGGDGTLRAAASVLAGGDTPLGVLPLGTLNHFARDMGMPLGLHAAVAAIAAGGPSVVDVAEVNGHIFLNTSALGAYPTIVYRRDARRRHYGLPKWLAALEASLRTLAAPPVVDLEVTIGETSDMLSTSFVLISNNRYRLRHPGFARRGALDGGELHLYATRHPGRARAALALGGALGGVRQSDAVLTRPCRETLVIDAEDDGLLVSLDGEVRRLAPPLRFVVRETCLPVIVPNRAP
jgi:diacylglycerol kinase family enzyme